MRRLVTCLIVATVVAAGSFSLTSSSRGGADDRVEGSEAEASEAEPVVVELFTSQGCSSCPPADRLLSALRDDDGVFPLAFHVDYWNYIGWTDPFSSEQWSRRQQSYARAMRTGRVYTPQLVVDGREHVVGSDEEAIRRLLGEARRRARSGRVELAATLADGAVSFEVGTVFADGPRPSLDLLVALYEVELLTPVATGENASRTLHNDFVVRRLEKLASIEPAAAAPAVRSRWPLERGWNRDRLGLVAFLQETESLAIHGAARWRGERGTGGS